MVGLPLRIIGEELGLTKKQVENWIRTHKGFKKAYQDGKNAARIRAYTSLYTQAFPFDRKTGEPTCKGDPSLMMFWMRTQAGWKEPERTIKLAGGTDEPPIIQFVKKEETKRDKDS